MQVRQLQKSHHHAGVGFSLNVPELALHASRTAVFQGTSGCGKSTLFDLLGLISTPDSVEQFTIHAQGRALEIPQAAESVLTRLRGRSMGYVLQQGGLIPSLTVRKNILLPCALNGIPHDEARLQQLVERLGIADQLTKKPGKLSGGQLQRAAIARALIHRPTIVLADEPTGQLDSYTAAEVRELLVSVAREEGVCLLVVTHDPQLFEEVADEGYGFETRRQGQHVASILHPLSRW